MNESIIKIDITHENVKISKYRLYCEQYQLHFKPNNKRFQFPIQSHHRRHDQHSLNIHFYVSFILTRLELEYRLSIQNEFELEILFTHSRGNSKGYSVISYLFCNIVGCLYSLLLNFSIETDELHGKRAFDEGK